MPRTASSISATVWIVMMLVTLAVGQVRADDWPAAQIKEVFSKITIPQIAT